VRAKNQSAQPASAPEIRSEMIRELVNILNKEWTKGCTNSIKRGGMKAVADQYMSILTPATAEALTIYPSRGIDQRRLLLWSVLKTIDPDGPSPEIDPYVRLRNLREILIEEKARGYDNKAIRGGIPGRRWNLQRYSASGAVTLLRVYPSLTIGNRKKLITLAIKELDQDKWTSTDLRLIRNLRTESGIQDVDIIALSTPNEISAEDWSKM
jgi:hypothetical protein